MFLWLSFLNKAAKPSFKLTQIATLGDETYETFTRFCKALDNAFPDVSIPGVAKLEGKKTQMRTLAQ